MNYYTSDLHFGQKSLLQTGKYKERPFQTLEEMNRELIERWNRKVTNGDHVYILGDIGKRGFKNMNVECLAQLKGSKHLILGNHDDISDLRVRQQFVEICDYKKISDNLDGKAFSVVMSHFPIMMWDGQHKGTILLYGHLHNTKDEELFQKYLHMYNQERPLKEGETLAQAYSVCSCLWEYEPVSLKEILENKEKVVVIR